MTERAIARLLLFAPFALALILLLILVGTSLRPLWVDELMAMLNYPVHGLAGLFDPLPYYSQAAPPLFNLICSAVAMVPRFVGRLVLGLIVVTGLIIAVAQAYGWRRALVSVALMSGLVPALPIYATELKFYSLEMAGVAIGAAWFLAKPRSARFGGADVAILTIGMICGLSSILIAGVATGLWATLSLIERRRFAASELAWAAVLALAAGGYYAAIRHGTAIQMHNFPNAYGMKGLDALPLFLLSIYRLFGNRFALIAIILLINLIDYRTRPTRDLLLLLGVVLLVCAALATSGLYPAISPRHVAWTNAFAVLLLANALRFLATALPRSGRVRQAATVLILGGLAMGATAMTAAKAVTSHFTLEENDRLVRWLNRQPQYEPIGLWAGAQPMVEYYRAHEPRLAPKRYFGFVDRSSHPIPDDFLSDAFLRQPHDRVGAAIEARRDMPGGYDLGVLYFLIKDHRPAADALIAQAPRGTSFLIAASHADWNSPLSVSVQFRTALVEALDAARCPYQLAFKAKEVFVLRAVCPIR